MAGKIARQDPAMARKMNKRRVYIPGFARRMELGAVLWLIIFAAGLWFGSH